MDSPTVNTSDHDTMSRGRVVVATTLLFFAKFFYWLLARGIYPFADEFSSRMHVSRVTFFLALSVGEILGALAVVTGGVPPPLHALRPVPAPSLRPW
jgi:hypothetical protein